jgi:ATP-dependent Lhr-like helicase
MKLFCRRLERLIEERGFTGLTEPQCRAIPEILKGKNVLLVAPTGTGKTEAAFLPLLNQLLLNPGGAGIRALYITPLRALNRDMLERLRWWCRKLDIKLGVRHGDTSAAERKAQAVAPPEVLITTPETLQALLPARRMKQHLKSVRYVVVDEVHELAESKRGSQLSLALERLRLLAGDFQLVGLSATIGSLEKVAGFLVGTGRSCEIIKVPVARGMRLQILYPMPSKEDQKLASRLYTHPEVAARLRVIKEHLDLYGHALLFTNTRSIAEILGSRFGVWDIDMPIAVHHGSLSKASRVSAEAGLKEGSLKGIVCTSSMELGIDIGRLDLVMQYNSPRQVTRLLQRIGRSGHAIDGIAEGVVITQDSEDFLEALVIGRRAYAEELEAAAIPEKPLDVLAHQLAGLLLEKNRWRLEDVLEIFRHAYPYRNLTQGELLSVLEYMSARYPRLAYLAGDVFMRPRRLDALYRYYFENLSMIPEERHFLVVEEEADLPIGLLDEAFVAEHGEIGTKFILRGAVWRVLQVYREKVFVSREEDPSGAVPSWVGEEMPVPFEVAQEVGKLWSRVEEAEATHTLVRELVKAYPCSEKELRRALKEAFEQVSMGLPLPTHERITIERWEEFLIMQGCFGLKVNRTLSRVLGYLISEKLGEPVKTQHDAYRVIITSHLEAEVLKQMLRQRVDLEAVVRKALEKTGIFRRRLIHVARKFGALEKKAELEAISLGSLLEAFRDTPVYEEAMRTCFLMDLDLPRTSEVLQKIRKGEIKVEVIQGLSPIAALGIREMEWKYDIIPPERMRKIILASTEARILSQAATLVCVACWRTVETRRIKDLPEELSCSSCGSRRVGLTKEGEEKAMEVAGRRLAGMEAPKGLKRLSKQLEGSAALIEQYGKKAVLALVSDITISDARRILKKHLGREEFLEEIVKAEREAMKRRFFATSSARR